MSLRPKNLISESEWTKLVNKKEEEAKKLSENLERFKGAMDHIKIHNQKVLNSIRQGDGKYTVRDILPM